MVIFKYPIKHINRVCQVQLPNGSRIIAGGVQSGTPVIWAMVDPNKGETLYNICVMFTGVELPKSAERMSYLNTITDEDGLVYHFFV